MNWVLEKNLDIGLFFFIFPSTISATKQNWAGVTQEFGGSVVVVKTTRPLTLGVEHMI